MSVIYANNSTSHRLIGKKLTESNERSYAYPPPRGDLPPLLIHLALRFSSIDALRSADVEIICYEMLLVNCSSIPKSRYVLLPQIFTLNELQRR